MKVFTSKDSEFWGSKVNFVDENNVLVGYDMDQCCCENADWFVDDKVVTSVPMDYALKERPDLEGCVFDKNFFQSIEGEWEWIAVFRIVNGEKELFLHLFNCHNGYYAHGFEMKLNGEIIREGEL